MKSEVLIVLEYFKNHNIVREKTTDRTEQVLQMLRTRDSESKHIGPCSAELKSGIERRSLISLYVQKRTIDTRDGQESPIHHRMFLRVGKLCLSCPYWDLDSSLFK